MMTAGHHLQLRGLTALGLGALFVTTAACGTASPTVDVYLADVRVNGLVPAGTSDGRIILAGAAVCALHADGNYFVPAVEQAAATEPFVAATLTHCDALFAQPLTDQQREHYGINDLMEDFRPFPTPETYAGPGGELPPATGITSAAAKPEVGEDSEDSEDWARMRADIAANGGEPNNSSENQYLWLCEMGELPPADCP